MGVAEQGREMCEVDWAEREWMGTAGRAVKGKGTLRDRERRGKGGDE